MARCYTLAALLLATLLVSRQFTHQPGRFIRLAGNC